MTDAQNNTQIIGLYNLGSSSPEGGSHLFVLENGKYAIIYFGGIQIGNWKFLDNEKCKFSPNSEEQDFKLFGRFNKNINNNMRIFFNGFEESQTFVHLGTVKENGCVMKRVFNIDANCFSYPYTHTFNTIEDSLSFTSQEYDNKNNPVITFKNPDGYNDFVAYFFHQNSTEKPFFARFKKDRLYFSDDDYSQKIPLEEDDEDTDFIINLVNKEINWDRIYYNPFYNLFEGDINENHVFNEQKGAYIDTEFYIEGVENSESDDSFDNMSIIYSFERLKNYTIETAKYTIDENSLFHVTCD